MKTFEEIVFNKLLNSKLPKTIGSFRSWEERSRKYDEEYFKLSRIPDAYSSKQVARTCGEFIYKRMKHCRIWSNRCAFIAELLFWWEAAHFKIAKPIKFAKNIGFSYGEKLYDEIIARNS